MNCTSCKPKTCKASQSCGSESFISNDIIEEYKIPKNQKIAQSAAKLVDGMKAGNYSRISEMIEFIKDMQYKNVGFAYCFGMENEVRAIKTIFKDNGIKVSAISCSIGGINQDDVNDTSCIHKVSCNPLGQAHQLNSEKTDFAIIIGICLGHDILLQRKLE